MQKPLLIGAIIGAIIIGIFVTVFSIDNTQQSGLDDNAVAISDSAETQQSGLDDNAVAISDSAIVELLPANNENFILDEEGNKVHIISAIDIPEFLD